MTPEPGIYKGVPFTEYQEWDAINNSTLWTIINQSPMHAKEYIENPPEPSQAFRFGRAQHCLLLEPVEFDTRYICSPVCDRRTKEGKAIYAQFEESADGKDIITHDEYLTLKIIEKQIKSQVLYRFIQNGEAEICIIWIDKRTGLKCKARLDYVHRKECILIDLKTTSDASKYSFANSIYNYGYFQQCAFYSDGWKALTGDDTAFVFLACEKTSPYAVAAYEMNDYVLRAGRKTYRKALKKYTECLKSDNWPGYFDSVELLDMPKWAYDRIGIGAYELESEEVNDQPKQSSGETIDWEKLEKEARESEGRS